MPATPEHRIIDRTLIVVVCVLAGLLLPACFGGSSTQKTYYSITYPTEQSWRYDQARYPFQVRIRRCESALAYDRQELVYRSNPHEFQYYWYRLWAAKPRKMLRQLVNDHLRATNLFQEVTLEIMESLPDYDLVCEVRAIEELNASQEEWYAHLSMRLSLVRFSDGQQVWEYSFDERKPVYNRQPVYVVRAISEVTESQLSRAYADLDEFLSQTTGFPAPSGGPTSGEVVGDKDGIEDGDGGDDSDDSDEPKAVLKKKKKR